MSETCRVIIAAVLACFILMFAPPVQSSEKAISELPLTLREALDRAIQNNDEIKKEDIEIAIFKARSKNAQGAFLPTLDLTGEAHHTTQYDKFSGYSVSTTIGEQTYNIQVEQSPTPYEFISKLELNYNLYAGGRDMALLEETAARQAASEYQKKATVRKVVLDVANAYWGLRKAQVTHGIAERWGKYYHDLKNIAEEEWKSGRISKIDLEIANLRLHEQKIAIAQSTRDVASNLKKYQRVLGLNNNDEGGGDAHTVTLVDDPDLEVVLPEPAITGSPAISKIEAEVKAAKAYRRSILAEYLPSFDFFVSYSWIGRDQDSFSGVFDNIRRNNYVVGLRLKLNIFDSFRTSQRAQQASLEEKRKQLHLEQKKKEISEIEHQKSMRVENAEDNLNLAQQRLKISEAKEKVARVQHEIGKYSEVEYLKERVLRSEDVDKVLMAKIDLIVARLNLALALVE